MANDSKSVRHRHETSTDGEATHLGWWIGDSRQVLEGLAKSNESLLRGMFDIAQEIITFSQARFRANVEALTSLSACQNVEDIVKFQQTFAETATNECLNEANKLTAQITRVLSGADFSVREKASKT